MCEFKWNIKLIPFNYSNKSNPYHFSNWNGSYNSMISHTVLDKHSVIRSIYFVRVQIIIIKIWYILEMHTYDHGISIDRIVCIPTPTIHIGRVVFDLVYVLWERFNVIKIHIITSYNYMQNAQAISALLIMTSSMGSD